MNNQTTFKTGDRVYAYKTHEAKPVPAIYISAGHAGGAICVSPHHHERFENGLTYDTCYYPRVTTLPESLTLNIRPLVNCQLVGTKLIVGEPEGTIELRWSRGGIDHLQQVTSPKGEYALMPADANSHLTIKRI